MENIDMTVDEIRMWINEHCGNIHIYDETGTAQLIKKLLKVIKQNLPTTLIDKE